MCLKNYIVSKCHLNLLILSSLTIFFSSFGINNKSQDKVVGDLDIHTFCIILLVIGILIFVYSFTNICVKKPYELL